MAMRLSKSDVKDDHSYLPRSKAKDEIERIQFRVFFEKSLWVKNLRTLVINWILTDRPVNV